MKWLAASLLSSARKFARSSDWPQAAAAYDAYLAKRPRHAAAWVQFGHAQKEIGAADTALVAYDRAIGIAPKMADTWLQKALVLKHMGRRVEAMDCLAQAVELDPVCEIAINELLDMGGRDRLPLSAVLPAAPSGPPLWAQAIEDRLRGDVYALTRYAEYRQELAILAPPRARSEDRERKCPAITVLIDARHAFPVDVRATLSSLRDQTEQRWTAIVFAPDAIRNHSVASLAAIDARIQLQPGDAPLPTDKATQLVMLMTAGTVIDRQTLAWFHFAVHRTGCAVAYSDHDEAIDDWRLGRRYQQPMFQPTYDPIWFSSHDCTPALLLIDTSKVTLPEHWSDQTIAETLAAGAAGEKSTHVPLLLASIRQTTPDAARALPDRVRRATQSPSADRAMRDDPGPQDQRIQVIIQTRDQHAMLRAAVVSMRRLAARPDLIDWTIVNNRSRESKTAALLRALYRLMKVDVIEHDEPFNWSRGNNIAAGRGTAPILLFANNDIEMLTDHWDTALRAAMARPEVGLVGALLQYPDSTIQHAGIVLGMGSGGPVHEGLGWPADAAGPMGRFSSPRAASAVTGAFMAISRSLFDRCSGFDDTQLAIAYNDIDLCLKVRELGLLVLQTPALQLIHYESKSRGINTTRSQVAWDLDELGSLFQKWGNGLFEDPGYNPHWTRIGQPFDGYRFPPMSEILHHLDNSALPSPWAVRRKNGASHGD